QPLLVPLRLRENLELLRPRRGEDLRIVDGDRVRERILALPAEPLDGMKRVAVSPEFLGVRVVVVVERPALEVRRVDDERVAVPLPDRITVEHRLETLAMGAAVERDDA